MQNIYQPNQETYFKAKALFEQDDLVAFPTETIYGLGANALSDVAAKKIFEVKGRPNDNPLIVHLGKKDQISTYAEIENEIQQRIIDKLMPGPITLLLKKKKSLISDIVCPVEYVGIRLPSNQIAQEMLTTVNLPIAAPSANISGKPSPTNATMVYDNLQEKVPMIIDGGESEAGIESSVVRVIENAGKHKILILRPGFVTKEDLESCFDGEIDVEYSQHNPELSPGMRYKHYSIDGQVKLITSIEETIFSSFGGVQAESNLGDGAEMTKNLGKKEIPFEQKVSGSFTSFKMTEKQVSKIANAQEKKIGFLITKEFFENNQAFFESNKDKALIKIWGTHQNLASCAHNLFDSYHYFDKEKVDILYVEKLEEVGIGYSIMNRVKRSAELH